MNNEARVKKSAFLFLLIAATSTGIVFAAQDVGKSPSANPLREEMIKLDGVFRDVVSAVALGDGISVRESLKTMHGTMEKTHEGVHAGKVKTPKNANRMEEFVKMDKAFHADLEALDGAAVRNDQKRMVALTKKLLDGCVSCHREFRK